MLKNRPALSISFFIKINIFFLIFLCIALFIPLDSFAKTTQTCTPPVNWLLTYNGDVWHGFQGGLQDRNSYLGKIDFSVNFDLEKLLHWQGGSALFEIQNIHGQRPNLYVHSIQGFDSIEYDRLSTMTYLYQLWLQKNTGKWSFLGGFYDLNSEFYLTESSKILILPTFGTGTELAQTGINGPSIFPVIGLALRLKYAPTINTYIQAALFDASAADPADPAYSHMPFSSGVGLLSILEAGHLFLDAQNKTLQGKIALGAWGYTVKVPTLVAPNDIFPPTFVYNTGMYGIVDYPLYINPHNADNMLHGFLRYGVATTAANPFNRALGAGVTLNGFMASRPHDILSFGISPAWTSSRSRLAYPDYPTLEFQSELTYAAEINRWISLQPDVQYLNFPHANHAIHQNAFLVGIRLTAAIS